MMGDTNNGHAGTFRVYPFHVTWQCSCNRSGRVDRKRHKGKEPNGVARAAWLVHTKTEEQVA